MDEVKTDNSEMIARLTRERDELRAEVERLRSTIEGLWESLREVESVRDEFAQCCTQRGARMQIMLEWMAARRLWQAFWPKYDAQHLNYVDVYGEGCEGWLNLFVGDHCICLVNDVDAANKIRAEVRQRYQHRNQKGETQ